MNKIIFNLSVFLTFVACMGGALGIYYSFRGLSDSIRINPKNNIGVRITFSFFPSSQLFYPFAIGFLQWQIMASPQHIEALAWASFGGSMLALFANITAGTTQGLLAGKLCEALADYPQPPAPPITMIMGLLMCETLSIIGAGIGNYSLGLAMKAAGM